MLGTLFRFAFRAGLLSLIVKALMNRSPRDGSPRRGDGRGPKSGPGHTATE